MRRDPTNTNYEQRRLDLTDYKRWDSTHGEERKAGEALGRSRANRESLRGNLYAPYNATRTLYQYA